jgi:hypothetical protein
VRKREREREREREKKGILHRREEDNMACRPILE